jgi:hypothetical protein
MKFHIIFAWLLQQHASVFTKAFSSAIFEITFPARLPSCIQPNRLLVFHIQYAFIVIFTKDRKVILELFTLNNSITTIKQFIN